MSDEDSHVERLLEELFETQSTPEQVCAQYPELLPQVRSTWRRMRRLDAHLSDLFPAIGEVPPPSDEELPQLEGYQVERILGRGGMASFSSASPAA
jgi:serine/threonine-protein kinase